MQLTRNDPIHPNGFPNLTGNPANAPRCGAYARTTGNPCKSPAVRGKQRCRMHGGAKGSGGQLGNKNRLIFGEYTAQGRALKFFMCVTDRWLGGDRRSSRHTVRNETEAREILKLFRVMGDDGMAERIAELWGMEMPTDRWNQPKKSATV